MRKQPTDTPADLQGQIERITYTNEENGYTIAKLKVYGRRDLVTIVGNLMAPMPGEIIRMRGEWANYPKYGEQFKIVQYKTTVPASVYGIEKYLGSGLIKGIGPVMAKRIVKGFGKKTLDVIEEDIESWKVKKRFLPAAMLEIIIRALWKIKIRTVKSIRMSEKALDTEDYLNNC